LLHHKPLLQVNLTDLLAFWLQIPIEYNVMSSSISALLDNM